MSKALLGTIAAIGTLALASIFYVGDQEPASRTLNNALSILAGRAESNVTQTEALNIMAGTTGLTPTDAANYIVANGVRLAIPAARTNTAPAVISGFFQATNEFKTTGTLGLSSQRWVELYPMWRKCRISLAGDGEGNQDKRAHGVKVWMGTKDAKIDGAYIRFWRRRPLAAGRATYLGISENFISKLTENTVCTVYFNAPTSFNLDEGDFTTMVLTATDQTVTSTQWSGSRAADGGADSESGIANAAQRYVFGGANAWPTGAPGNNYNWEVTSSSLYADGCVKWQILGAPPAVAGFGYSIVMGANLGESMIRDPGVAAAADTNNVISNVTLLPTFCNERNLTYQNFGIGGQTSDQLRLRISRTVARSKCRLAIVQMGGNDYSTVPIARFVTNVRATLDSLQARGSQALVLSITHSQIYTAARNASVDSFNVALKNTVQDHPSNPLWCDLDPFMHVLTAGNVGGNRHKLVAAYSHGDSLHPNATGYAALNTGVDTRTLRFDMTRP